MTPEAKPNNDFCRRTDISSFMKKTKAAPSIVPSKGISKPTNRTVIRVMDLRVYSTGCGKSNEKKYNSQKKSPAVLKICYLSTHRRMVVSVPRNK